MIMRGVLLVIIVLAIVGGAPAQPPQPPAGSPGERLRNEGDIPGAIAEFEKVYARDPKDLANIHNLARALSIHRDLDRCFHFLELAVGLGPSLEILLDPDLVTARRDKRWGAFEDKLVAALNAGPDRPYKDVDYARALWRLRAWDQAYFVEIGIAGRKTGLKSSVAEAMWAFKFMIQEKNQAELEALVARKGWPRVGDVGREAAMGAYLVAMHSRDGAQKRYLADVKKACEAGELPWVRYANFYYRALFNEGKPQRYGTHTMYNEKTGGQDLYPLEDEARVAEWRKELGLEPLEDYLKPFGIVYRPKK